MLFRVRGVNPGAQDANVKEKTVGIHLLPDPFEVSLIGLIRLVCQLGQQPLQSIE